MTSADDDHSLSAHLTGPVVPSEPQENDLPMCLDFLKGRCKRDKCRFLHPDLSQYHQLSGAVRARTGRRVCEVWAMTGQCKFGAKCTRLHPSIVVGPQPQPALTLMLPLGLTSQLMPRPTAEPSASSPTLPQYGPLHAPPTHPWTAANLHALQPVVLPSGLVGQPTVTAWPPAPVGQSSVSRPTRPAGAIRPNTAAMAAPLSWSPNPPPPVPRNAASSSSSPPDPRHVAPPPAAVPLEAEVKAPVWPLVPGVGADPRKPQFQVGAGTGLIHTCLSSGQLPGWPPLPLAPLAGPPSAAPTPTDWELALLAVLRRLQGSG